MALTDAEQGKVTKYAHDLRDSSHAAQWPELSSWKRFVGLKVGERTLVLEELARL